MNVGRGQHLAGRDVIGMPVLPVRHGDRPGPVAADEIDGRPDDLGPLLDAAVRPAERLAPAAPSTRAASSPSARRSAGVPLLPSSPAVRSQRPTDRPSAACRATVPAEADFNIVRMRTEDNQIDRHRFDSNAGLVCSASHSGLTAQEERVIAGMRMGGRRGSGQLRGNTGPGVWEGYSELGGVSSGLTRDFNFRNIQRGYYDKPSRIMAAGRGLKDWMDETQRSGWMDPASRTASAVLAAVASLRKQLGAGREHRGSQPLSPPGAQRGALPKAWTGSR